MDEEITILLAKEGNQSAFRRLYEDHRERIYRLARRYTASQQEAEDMLQETFIRAFESIHRFNYRHSSSFSAWLNKICCNCCLSHLRKNGKVKNADVELNEIAESEANNPMRATQNAQMIAELTKVLKILSPKQRILFDMRYGQHWRIREIAEAMQCSESTVKTQLSRALQKLKKQLQPILEE